MTASAVRTGAVNLGQGFPDTDGPMGMLQMARRAIAEGVNQYPPGPGRPELRAAIAAHRMEQSGIEYDADTQVLVTAGATEAIAAALIALVEPGDEVVVIEPYYDSYAAAIAMAGGVRRAVPLRSNAETGRFELDLDALRGVVGPATRAILVNSPHNPTGTVLSSAELAAIASVCVEHDVLAITDEVYEQLIFGDAREGTRHRTLAALPGMAERTLVISSAGKSFSVTGWKIGWVCGPVELVHATKAAKQFLTFTGGAPFQPAVAHALRHELAWVERLRADLQAKRDRLGEGLATAGFRVLPSEGTYFVCADVRPLGYTDGEVLCRAMPEQIGVAAIPVAAFCDDPEPVRHLVRFAFCKRNEVLDEALRRLRRL
ncbi:aspartate/tyrosine/aromatic aminotransferase [Actinoalloteichus hymeniacidonis]|uniref:Aspartate/tyrosine/aromatic aminotransferase n=2 Tax=Actinoalloteichus hymeniacidonis TaxID=340345 RepID=A0AAC9HV13_9PSEU|nr:aspartate/tyrosine/aromatic aminotransferase [Actinoalloteichus hymeniacidonis]